MIPGVTIDYSPVDKILVGVNNIDNESCTSMAFGFEYFLENQPFSLENYVKRG